MQNVKGAVNTDSNMPVPMALQKTLGRKSMPSRFCRCAYEEE